MKLLLRLLNNMMSPKYDEDWEPIGNVKVVLPIRPFCRPVDNFDTVDSIGCSYRRTSEPSGEFHMLYHLHESHFVSHLQVVSKDTGALHSS